jgi:ankyrin
VRLFIAFWSIIVLSSSAIASEDRRVADAAKSRDTDRVRALISERADIKGRHPDGATALHWAVHWDDVETATLLLRAGADPNAANDLGVTPLSLACANANVTIATALLEAGADPKLALPSGETPLMTAAHTGRPELARALLDRGADVHATERVLGQSALMWAVAERHAAVVRLLLERGANPAQRSASGFSPLLFAARVGDISIGAQLLDAGANVNASATDGTRALLVATVRGHVEFSTFVLERGADPNAPGPGYSALHWASGSWETELSGPRGVNIERDEEWVGVRGLGDKRLTLVRALLAHGADPNVVVTKAPPRVGFTVFRSSLAGATPFLLAAMAGHADVMQVLADAGADTRRPMKDGTTPLMVASGVGRVLAETRLDADGSADAARLAWKLGGDANAANAAGDTALHGAAHIRSDTLVRFLVEKGAALDVANKRGETPLFIAERTVAAGSAPVFVRTSTGDLLRALGAKGDPPPAPAGVR